VQAQSNVDTVNSQNTTYVLIFALSGYNDSITGFSRLADTVRTLWQSMYARLYDHIDNTQLYVYLIVHVTAFLT